MKLVYVFLGAVLLSWSTCIKPPNIILLFFILGWFFINSRKEERFSFFLSALAGSLLPWLVCLGYLLRNGAVHAYWENLRSIEAYHVGLDRKPLSYLLPHAFSPILWIFVLALPLAIHRIRPRFATIEGLLSLAAAAGLLSYILQGKGFSYQRYPFLIFVIPLIALWLADSFPAAVWRGGLRLCLVFAVLASICTMVHKASTYSHTEPDFSLMSDLSRLGATNASGSIQCLDTAGGCIETLYKDRLVQSTGFIYDCYFEDSNDARVRSLRARFERELERTRPTWIIETNSSCFSGPRTFNKYPGWKNFNDYISQRYTLVLQRQPTQLQHYWSRWLLPYAYRIYRIR